MRRHCGRVTLGITGTVMNDFWSLPLWLFEASHFYLPCFDSFCGGEWGVVERRAWRFSESCLGSLFKQKLTTQFFL